jgi:hypothetical protein
VLAEPAPAGRIGAAVRAAGSMSRINSRTFLIVYSVLPLFTGRTKRPVLRSLAAVILVSGKRNSNAKDTATEGRQCQLRESRERKELVLAAPLS